MPRKLFKLKSKAVPNKARLSSTSSNWPLHYILREDGSYLLREDGTRFKREKT